MTATPNHYELLGIAPSATAKEIKKAYHTLVMLHHPDHAKLEDHGERFRAIQAAYDTLKDRKRRTLYDSTQGIMKAPSPGATKKQDFSGVFSQLVDEMSQLKASNSPQDDYHDVRINYAVAGLLAIIAILLLIGSVTPGLGLVFGLSLLALGGWYYREEALDFVETLTPGRAAAAWLPVMLWVFSAMHYAAFVRVFGHQQEEPNQLVLAVFRFAVFLCWLVVSSPLHIFFQAALVVWLVLMFKRFYAGWTLLALWVFIAIMIRYDTQLMSGFAIHYETLFSIQPLQPR